MANTFAPFGFRQYSGTGSAPTYEQVAVKILYSGSLNPIFFGDPVVANADGTVSQAVTSLSTGNPTIAGVFVGCKYLSVATKRTQWSNYWPGSDITSGTYAEGYIVNDPNAKFVAQAGSALTVATTDVNANIGFNIGTGTTSNGISGAYLATIGTDSSLPFRVVSLVTDPPGSNGTDTASNGNYVVVAFNNVATKQLTGI